MSRHSRYVRWSAFDREDRWDGLARIFGAIGGAVGIGLTVYETVQHWEQLQGGGAVAVVFGCAFMAAIVGAAGVIVGLVVLGVIRWTAARVSRLLEPSPPRRRP